PGESLPDARQHADVDDLVACLAAALRAHVRHRAARRRPVHSYEAPGSLLLHAPGYDRGNLARSILRGHSVIAVGNGSCFRDFLSIGIGAVPDTEEFSGGLSGLLRQSS